MKNVKIFILFMMLSILFMSCTKNHEQIIITVGLSENPDEPRYGIELSQKKMYYCEEIMPSSGKYNYYYTTISRNKFQKIYNGINKIFNKIKTELPKADGRIYELIIIDKDSKITKKFNGTQFQEIRDLIELKEIPMNKISFYEFPKDLLEEKLPPPPPPDTTIKYEIRYNGKDFLFNNKAERKRFLDSLNIKDTLVHGLD